MLQRSPTMKIATSQRFYEVESVRISKKAPHAY